MKHLKRFRNVATPAEQQELAQAAGTTCSYLFDQLGAHRKVSVEKAEAIEAATIKIAGQNNGRTPVLYRDMICEPCSTCPLACAARRPA